MSHIITIEGDPSGSAKASAALQAAQGYLRRAGVHSSVLRARNLPADDLALGRRDSPALLAAQCLIEQAQGVIVATPIYHASFSGLLKLLLDALPPDALRDKIVLPLATGGSDAQGLALDYALHPVLTSLGATYILPGVAVTDAQITFGHGGVTQIEEAAETRLRESVAELIAQTQRFLAFAPNQRFDWPDALRRKEDAAVAPPSMDVFQI